MKKIIAGLFILASSVAIGRGSVYHPVGSIHATVPSDWASAYCTISNHQGQSAYGWAINGKCNFDNLYPAGTWYIEAFNEPNTAPDHNFPATATVVMPQSTYDVFVMLLDGEPDGQ
jgi:hypothetical protein